MSEVVTGDAVVLDVQIAQLPVRAVSALIDITVMFICYVLGLMLWAASLTQFDTRAEHGRADHLHGAGDARLSVDFRNRHAGTISGQDRDGPASGVRRWRARTVPAGPVSRAGLGDRNLDVPGQPRGDQQHLVAESQTHRRHLRRHNHRQRTRTPIGATADDAAGAGVVGVVAAAVRPRCRSGRSCAPIPFPGTATRSSVTAADGISHRQRRGITGSLRRPHPALRRSWCLPPSSPNDTAGNMRDFVRRRRWDPRPGRRDRHPGRPDPNFPARQSHGRSRDRHRRLLGRRRISTAASRRLTSRRV